MLVMQVDPHELNEAARPAIVRGVIRRNRWLAAVSSFPSATYASGRRRTDPLRINQMARTGTVAALAPQAPERIEESRVRYAESILNRQRYFT